MQCLFYCFLKVFVVECDMQIGFDIECFEDVLCDDFIGMFGVVVFRIVRVDDIDCM